MAYLPIDQYGVVGDLHTAALVGRNGSVDWLCLPRFDSPSLFAALLDDRIGGYFKICATGQATSRQMYVPDTNVLVTRFVTPDGVAELYDCMPVEVDTPGEQALTHQLLRVVHGVRGTVQLELECRPAFDYARVGHTVGELAHGCVFTSVAPVGEKPVRVSLLAALARDVDLSRTLAGAGGAVGPGPQAANLCADRRDHRRSDHQFTGDDRRHP